MRIPLEHLAGDAQQEFFDHFNAALRGTDSLGGSSGFNDDGSFEVKLDCVFPVGNSHAWLRWQWIRSPDGSVDWLEVVPEGEAPPPTGWEDAAREFVMRVLVLALQKKRAEFYTRNLYCYIGVNLDGEYWFRGMRVAPAFWDDPSPYLINCERALYIDQNVAGVDAVHAGLRGAERARRVAARISLLLNVGLYQPSPDLRFVLNTEGEPEAVPVRRYLGFLDHKPRPVRMPPKGVECVAGEYRLSESGEIGRPDVKLKFPAETRRIFRAADDPAHLFGEAFDRCARLYQVSLVAGKHFHTVRLAYQVAAVEAISAAIPEIAGFSQFMRKYAPAMDNLDPLLDYLYGTVRSAHFHAGSFPLGDFMATGFDLTDSDQLERFTLSYTAQQLIRQAILLWAREASAAIDNRIGKK